MNSYVTNTKNSSLSNTTSKEKNNFNKNTKYVEVNLKDDKMLKNHMLSVRGGRWGPHHARDGSTHQ